VQCSSEEGERSWTLSYIRENGSESRAGRSVERVHVRVYVGRCEERERERERCGVQGGRSALVDLVGWVSG
jgi:hypothetical protein